MEIESFRINRYLALCGVASRRKSEELVLQGFVTINGKICQDLHQRVTLEDAIKLHGKRLTPKQLTTILLYKPKGILCTRNDPKGRQTVYDLLPPKLQNLHYVGRLDRDSEGLILFTNDGTFSQRVTRPEFKVPKYYKVTVNKAISDRTIQRCLEGIETPVGTAIAQEVTVLNERTLQMVLTTGINRQIRRMMTACDLKVTRLIRIQIAQLDRSVLRKKPYVYLEPHQLKLFS